MISDDWVAERVGFQASYVAVDYGQIAVGKFNVFNGDNR